jgi:hypothetical protein
MDTTDAFYGERPFTSREESLIQENPLKHLRATAMGPPAREQKISACGIRELKLSRIQRCSRKHPQQREVLLPV